MLPHQRQPADHEGDIRYDRRKMINPGMVSERPVHEDQAHIVERRMYVPGRRLKHISEAHLSEPQRKRLISPEIVIKHSSQIEGNENRRIKQQRRIYQ